MRGIVMVALLVAPSWTVTPASEPGQPMDCSDLVSVVPGPTVTRLTPSGCVGGVPGSLCAASSMSVAVDTPKFRYVFNVWTETVVPSWPPA